MIAHDALSILFVANDGDDRIDPLAGYLRKMPHLTVARMPAVPKDLSGVHVVVTTAAPSQRMDDLVDSVHAGCGWLHILPENETEPAPIFGVRPGPPGPVCELRVMFKKKGHPLSVRLPDAVYIRSTHRALEIEKEDVDPILYADWHYRHSVLLAERTCGKGRVACTTMSEFTHPVVHQVFYRLLRRLSGFPEPVADIGIGILGYAPWAGPLHGTGARMTPGLSLNAVCDLNPDRRQQAEQDFPGVRTFASASELAADPSVHLVIISTAPDIHAVLTREMMAAGKHVVCEKPLCLTAAEADAMYQQADRANLHLSCHQNRRFDPDYLAIREILTAGRIGEPFYLETFVGGFSHPCGYWHSHAPVSGGTAWDWGAHYIDWIVALFPYDVESVRGTRHKRVWPDVTNADQERIHIRFTDGREAEFIHSDIAALRKPKWYLLGTKGAIVGKWQDITAFDIDPLLYYERNEIPSTEMPPDLIVRVCLENGRFDEHKPELPGRSHFAFHRNLADHLLFGEPLAAPLADSMRVVRILEAAARSMDRGGTVEVVNG